MTRTWPDRRTLTPMWIIAAVLLVASVAAFAWRGSLYDAVALDRSTLSEATAQVASQIASKLPFFLYLCLIALAGISLMNRWVTWQYALAALVAPGCAWVFNRILKVLVVEARPCSVRVIEPVTACPVGDDWSWPSGHSAMAAGTAVACVLLLPNIWPLAVIGAGLAAYARVAVGVHYVHDVLSGLGIGIVTTVLFFYLGNAILCALFPPGRGRHVSVD